MPNWKQNKMEHGDGFILPRRTHIIVVISLEQGFKQYKFILSNILTHHYFILHFQQG